MKYALRYLVPVFILSAFAAVASDMKLEAKLVWGTNDDKDGASFKPVDAELSSKLHCMFKWKNYYEITNLLATVESNKTRDLKMSERCTLRLTSTSASRLEVRCIGQGKEVYQGTYTLARPSWLVLGGNATNDTAWFIGLRAVDDSARVVSKN